MSAHRLQPSWRVPVPTTSRHQMVMAGGVLLVVLASLASLCLGAYPIPAAELPGLLMQWLSGMTDAAAAPSGAALVLGNIRLPRVLLAICAGAALGLAGALMQGLFRNPLADPGLIGVSSGAALAAAFSIVVLGSLLPELPRRLGSWTLVASAFAGGALVSTLIYGLSRGGGRADVAQMLLAGIALNSLAGAGLGLLSFLASDEQLRSLQFWLLGSLGGASWPTLALVAPLVLICGLMALRQARPLDALALGEEQAASMGVPVERFKRTAIVQAALLVAAVSATAGIIGFIGLVAPHMIRLIAGPAHRTVLAGSVLLGAALVLLADTVARTLAQPAELPLGVLTALMGVPFFLVLLRRQQLPS